MKGELNLSPGPNKHVYIPFPRPQAALRVICLPHAGGSAGAYRPIASHLQSDIELVAVQLPGHGARFREPPFQDMHSLIADLTQHLRPWLDKPWILMGHSFGCRVAFELAHAQARAGQSLPRHFIASACRAFHLASKRISQASLSDETLMQRTRVLGGTPEEVIQNKQLMALLLPALRADMAIADAHQVGPRKRLPMPATVMMGSQDLSTPEHSGPAWQAWQAYFRDHVAMAEFDAGHFFINSHPKQVARCINRIGCEILHALQTEPARWPMHNRPNSQLCYNNAFNAILQSSNPPTIQA